MSINDSEKLGSLIRNVEKYGSAIPQAPKTYGLGPPRVLGSGAATEGGGRIVVSQTKTPNSWRREFPEALTVAQALPFKISVTATSLVAAPGTVNGVTHDEEVNTTMTNGTWYFRVKVVISSTTGAVSSTDVLWSTSEASDTSTTFYTTLAIVDIVSGVPDGSTISQFNYGPIMVLPYGTPTDKWGVLMF
jgi:hypothetical protein